MSGFGKGRTAMALASAVAATLASAALPARTMAADLDQLFVATPPDSAPVQPVEFGTGWYIRGDAAFARDSLPNVDPYGLFPTGSSLQNTYSFGLGAGYKFTNVFRTDVTADYRQPESAYDPITFTNANGGRWDVLFNGYIDLGSFIGDWNGIQPYVGAGVGAAWGYTKITTSNPADPCTNDGAQQCYNNHIPASLAWALMAGVAIPIFPHAFLDVGYRYLDLGNYSFFDSSYWSQLSGGGLTAAAHSRVNEFRVGFRYQID
jgi:opacity protein-like surface antigen